MPTDPMQELIEAAKALYAECLDAEAADDLRCVRCQTLSRLRSAISRAEQAQGVERWRPMCERPNARSKIAILYADGSGARLYYVTDEGELIDGEDGCTYTWEVRNQRSAWAYLPWSHKLWIEIDPEPITLPPPPGSEPAPAPVWRPDVEEVARIIEPLAWAALGIGDTMVHKSQRTGALRKAQAILALSPEGKERAQSEPCADAGAHIPRSPRGPSPDPEGDNHERR